MKFIFTILLYFIILLYSSMNLFSQGFDWQYSSRMPSQYPGVFIGGVVGVSYVYDIADFDFSSDYVVCTKFDKGSGRAVSYGVKSEYWLSGSQAINFSFSYVNYTSEFSEEQSWLAINIEEYYKTYRYVYNSTFSYISSEFNYKFRFEPNHFFVSFAFATEFAFQRDNKFTEEAISPENLLFTDGRRKHDIVYGDIAPVATISIIPKIKFGYDMNIGKSRYASIAFSLGYSANSILKSGVWHRFMPSLEISIYQGMFYN